MNSRRKRSEFDEFVGARALFWFCVSFIIAMLVMLPTIRSTRDYVLSTDTALIGMGICFMAMGIVLSFMFMFSSFEYCAFCILNKWNPKKTR